MFNKRLSELRTEKNISQTELSQIMNVTPQAVSKWENGNSVPDIDTIKKLSQYFDVSVDYITGNADIKNPNAQTPLAPALSPFESIKTTEVYEFNLPKEAMKKRKKALITVSLIQTILFILLAAVQIISDKTEYAYLSALGLLYASSVLNRFIRRYNTYEDMPANLLTKREIKGYAAWMNIFPTLFMLAYFILIFAVYGDIREILLIAVIALPLLIMCMIVLVMHGLFYNGKIKKVSKPDNQIAAYKPNKKFTWVYIICLILVAVTAVMGVIGETSASNKNLNHYFSKVELYPGTSGGYYQLTMAKDMEITELSVSIICKSSSLEYGQKRVTGIKSGTYYVTTLKNVSVEKGDKIKINYTKNGNTGPIMAEIKINGKIFDKFNWE